MRINRSILLNSYINVSSFRWNWGTCFIPVCILYKWLNGRVFLVILLNCLFLRNRIFECSDCIELRHCVLVKSVNTSECALSDGLLVVCQKESSELGSLEEVFSMILRLRHCQHFNSIRSWIIYRCDILCPHRNLSLWQYFLWLHFRIVLHFRVVFGAWLIGFILQPCWHYGGLLSDPLSLQRSPCLKAGQYGCIILALYERILSTEFLMISLVVDIWQFLNIRWYTVDWVLV